MIVSAIEAYLNHIIPNDFVYRTIRKTKTMEFNKDAIESSKISFIEKLNDIIPQWLRDYSFWQRNLTEKENILKLY